MNTKAMIDKEEIRVAATLQLSRPPKLNSTKVRIKTKIATNEELLKKLKSQSKERKINLRFLSADAIKQANAEILEQYFEGISPEEFILKFPYLDKPSTEYNSQFLVTTDYATYTVAEIFAAASNQTFSDYVNNAIWKALTNFSLQRLKDLMRQRYG
ncbi:MAG: hypothetical protein ACRC11_18135 [Xenococcaceae cyanobacterium]